MAVVGRIARPHGLRGHVVLDVETDFPEERFRAGAQLFVNRSGQVEPIVLTEVRFQRGRPIVRIGGVERLEEAEPLSGLELRIPADRLVPLPAGSFYVHDLVGCRVETADGRSVGNVVAVEGASGSNRLVVTSGQGEVLIPLASEICTSIDPASRRIVIAPPEGLLDLNA